MSLLGRWMSVALSVKGGQGTLFSREDHALWTSCGSFNYEKEKKAYDECMDG